MREAKKWFDLAIEKGGQGSRIQAYQNRAWLHLEAAEWEEAANDLGSLLITTSGTKSTDQVFDLWLEKGIAEYGAKRIDDAEKSFSKIPNDPRAKNNLGNIAWKQKKNDTAAEHFERAINEDPAEQRSAKAAQKAAQQAHAGNRNDPHEQGATPYECASFATSCESLQNSANEMAEVHGNRTHRPRCSRGPTGFEDRAAHQHRSTPTGGLGV